MLRGEREGNLPPHPHSYNVLMGTQVKGTPSPTHGEYICACTVWMVSVKRKKITRIKEYEQVDYNVILTDTIC